MRKRLFGVQSYKGLCCSYTELLNIVKCGSVQKYLIKLNLQFSFVYCASSQRYMKFIQRRFSVDDVASMLRQRCIDVM